MRQTHAFPEAFAKAVPLNQQREVEAGKSDGFSNPQIRKGPQITPVLQALEQRLQALVPSVTFSAGNELRNNAIRIRGVGTDVFSTGVEPEGTQITISG